MKLAPEHEAVLAGQSGLGVARAMKTLVAYGRAFGAKRLVRIASAHLAGTFRIARFKAYYEIIDQLAGQGARFVVPTTLNPRPGYDFSPQNRLVFGRQQAHEKNLEALGVTPNYSCVCYEGANVPAFGDRLGWAESSAVQFANSVLGARTNRNSVLIDLCCALTGTTPEFGYLLDENRKGKLLVKLKIDRMDPSALGFLLGQKVVDKVPVLEHVALDRVDLKNMGGSMAASGAVALFHVEGVTPEAPDLQTAFDGQPESTITLTQADLDKLRTGQPDRASMVVFGCPQMTFDEAVRVGGHFVGKTVKRPTHFCLIPEAKKQLEKDGLHEELLRAGVKIYSHCPLAALSVRRPRHFVLTNSGKLFYYLQGADYGTLKDCLKTCGV